MKATVEFKPDSSQDDTRRIQDAIDRVSKLPADKNGIRGAVLIRRGSETRLVPLREAPLPRHTYTCSNIYAAWPELFVTAAHNNGGCARTRHVLWRSRDGGGDWKLQSTAIVGRKPSAVKGGSPGAKVTVPGGWVAALKGPPARLAIRALGAALSRREEDRSLRLRWQL